MSNDSRPALAQLNAYQECNYNCRRVRLTSPLIHIGIGAAGALNLFEYVQENSKIYVPNQTALAEALHNSGKIHKSQEKPQALQRKISSRKLDSGYFEDYKKLSQQYIQVIERKDFNQSRDLKDILEKIKQLYDKALGSKWLDNQEIFPENGISQKWVNQPITKDIAPMIRNGFAEIYIPGSSIKGAIRSALAYYLLKHQAPTRVSEIEQKIRELRPKQLSDKKTALDDEQMLKIANDKKISMNSYLFSNFKLNFANRRFGEPNTPNTDFMRAIKVADSGPLLTDFDDDVNLPVVAEVISSSFKEDRNQRIAQSRATNYIEMIWNLQTEFTICIDTEMLDRFQHEQSIQLPSQLKTVEGIIKICHEFAHDQWEYEQQYWNTITDTQGLDFSSIRNFYDEPSNYNLRLGWGSGMIGTTVFLHLEEQVRAAIRNACCPKRTSSLEAPKSRRTAVIPDRDNPIKKPLGWVNLTPL
jgi:CRISPR-associated protein Csm5